MTSYPTEIPDDSSVVEESAADGPLSSKTKTFALKIIDLCGQLPKSSAADVIGKQLIRSGTSVGAQYREARRSRSDAEFISKLQGSLQEADESSYWLELLMEAKIIGAEKIRPVLTEAEELTAMLVSSIRTVKDRIGSKV